LTYTRRSVVHNNHMNTSRDHALFLMEQWDDFEDEYPDNPAFGADNFEAYRQANNLDESVTTEFVTYTSRTRDPNLVAVQGNLLSKENFPKIIRAIRSMVGDDETITSNSLFYNLLCVLIGPHAAGIKISWSDVGFHKDFYNYAEGWIFLPPSARASFEYVNKHARGRGVPFVLDPVKLKNLSAVRKQSEMERDLPSKFRSISEAASWTNRHWPTYHLHQFSLILALELFDFIRSKTYPFLFKSEGGCGGIPPWGNLHTAAGMTYRYGRGRSKRGILGIMEESNMMLAGQLKPEDSIFVKNLNLAISGDSRWRDIRGHLETIKREAKEEGLEYFPTVNQAAEDLVPDELIAKSATIHPQDVVTAVAISFLRAKDYIATELDVVMALEERKRLDAIWGKISLGEVADQIELRKQEYKDAFLEVLSSLSQLKHPDPSVQRRLDLIGPPFSPSSLEVMAQYYSNRSDQENFVTSFIYNERVRIFKKDDLVKYLDKGVSYLRDRFASSVQSFYRPDHRRSIQLPSDKEQFDKIEEWLYSAPLEELLSQPVPTGIGPDDARIVRTLILKFQKDLVLTGRGKKHGRLILLITSDRRLIDATASTLGHHFPDTEFRVVGLPVRDYLAWCLTDVTRSKKRPIIWLKGREIFSVIDGEKRAIDGILYDLLVGEAEFLYKNHILEFVVEYDYPNINRTLQRYNFDKDVLYETSGGYLMKDTLTSDPLFVIRNFDEIKHHGDFYHGRPRAVVDLNLGKRSLRLNRAYSMRDSFSDPLESSDMRPRPGRSRSSQLPTLENLPE